MATGYRGLLRNSYKAVKGFLRGYWIFLRGLDILKGTLKGTYLRGLDIGYCTLQFRDCGTKAGPQNNKKTKAGLRTVGCPNGGTEGS